MIHILHAVMLIRLGKLFGIYMHDDGAKNMISLADTIIPVIQNVKLKFLFRRN